MTNQEPDLASTEKTPLVRFNYTYSPVIVNDVLGALFLGILAVTLLIGWIRAEARNRALIAQ